MIVIRLETKHDNTNCNTVIAESIMLLEDVESRGSKTNFLQNRKASSQH